MGHFVLVHGGMHASWSWEPIVDPLTAAGNTVDLVDLPGRPGGLPYTGAGMDPYQFVVEDAVRRVGEPVVLVAHSMGGISACLALQNVGCLVDRVVFVNALLVADGQAAIPTLAAVGPGSCAMLAEGAMEVSADGSVFSSSSSDAAVEAFYNRCSRSVARAAVARLCPEPFEPAMTPISMDVNTFASVPKTYIGSRHDHMLSWDFQHRVAREFGAEFVELDGDHSPVYSATDDLLGCLLSLVK